MRVVVYELRRDGKRLEPGEYLNRPLSGLLKMTNTETVHYRGSMLQIGTRGPRSFEHATRPLYEPKLIEMQEQSGKWRMHFLGFQSTGLGAATVQEWICDIG